MDPQLSRCRHEQELPSDVDASHSNEDRVPVDVSRCLCRLAILSFSLRHTNFPSLWAHFWPRHSPTRLPPSSDPSSALLEVFGTHLWWWGWLLLGCGATWEQMLTSRVLWLHIKSYVGIRTFKIKNCQKIAVHWQSCQLASVIGVGYWTNNSMGV